MQKDSQVSPEITQIQPLLFSSRLFAATTNSEEGSRDYFFTIRRLNDEDDGKRKWLNAVDENESRILDSLRYDVSLDRQSLEDLRKEWVSGEAVGCLLHHFRPEQITLGVDMVAEDAQAIVDVLTSERAILRGTLLGDLIMPVMRSGFWDHDIPVPQRVLDFMLNIAESNEGECDTTLRSRLETYQRSDSVGLSGSMFLKVLVNVLGDLKPDYSLKIRRQLSEDEEFKEVVRKSCRADRDQQPKVISHSLPDGIAAASLYIDQFFSSCVKYLGPLRDEPKSLYPLSPTADPSDVGLKGEHTAAVLELHKNRLVQYIPTSAFANTEVNPQPTRRSLEAAVVDWLRYLGVATELESSDKGKFGHELAVQIPETERTYDLTHVGVGVSQVLPILVVSLLSDADTTLIFEQPELHLHPRVQTRLADFFLSITQLGKQCVIETHSEYFVSRIRFRTAAAVTRNPWVEDVKVYFVERDERGSSFQPVIINEYGAILDWPEGFFDQSHGEAEAILRAASIKSRAKRDH